MAVLALYLDADFAVTERHRMWLKLFRDVASSFIARRLAIADCRGERDNAIRVQRDLTAKLEVMRSRIREHLLEVAKAGADSRAGALSVKAAVSKVEKSAKALYVMSAASSPSPVVSAVEFRNSELSAWVSRGLKDPRIKVLRGIRGSNKSALLHKIRNRILADGVKESQVAFIDFENAHFRSFKTVKDVLHHLEQFPASKEPKYLFLDEVGMVSWDAELLQRLAQDRQWNVWVATSSAHALKLSDRKQCLDLLVYRTWTDSGLPRSHSELENIWGQIFMRDAFGGSESQDLRAKEAVAEYYSEHLGEVRSLRDVSGEVRVGGRRLSTMSIRSYRQALEDSHLIEFSKLYNTFEGVVLTRISGRAFYTDLELRNWRFGGAQTHDTTREALNRLYLKLRRQYAEVYTPSDRDVDFVTLDARGKPQFWSLDSDSLYCPECFRWGGVKFKKVGRNG